MSKADAELRAPFERMPGSTRGRELYNTFKILYTGHGKFPLSDRPFLVIPIYYTPIENKSQVRVFNILYFFFRGKCVFLVKIRLDIRLYIMYTNTIKYKL